MMGALLSIYRYLLGSDESLDVPDPATGLTKREKDLIRQSWSVIELDLKGNGVALFMKLFLANPGYQNFFESFIGIPTEELATSPKLRAHGSTVMHALSSIVDNLDDPECLVGLLQKTAQNHHKRGLKPSHFVVVTDTLIAYMAETLTRNWSAQTKEAWTKTCGVINTVIDEEYTKINNAKQ